MKGIVGGSVEQTDHGIKDIQSKLTPEVQLTIIKLDKLFAQSS